MASTFRTLADVFGRRAPKMEDLAAQQQDFLRSAADMGEERLAQYETFEAAYDGDNALELTDRQAEFLEANGIRFKENMSGTVLDTHRRRLRVRGFDVEDRQDVADWITKTFWRRGRLASLATTVHARMLGVGDAGVFPDWDSTTGRPMAFYVPANRCKFVYGDRGELLYVPKVWDTARTSPQNPRGERIRRLNIYFPDRVEKWFAASHGPGALWAPYVDPDDVDRRTRAATWPLPWTVNGRVDGEPLGILAVHFRHMALGDTYGRSLLRAVIPFEDELQKQVLDLFQVMDKQGWSLRWASGIAAGEPLDADIGEWVTSTSKDARFGEFTAQDPRPLVETIEATLRRLSVATATPLHDLLIVSGNAPSGESRKDASTPLVAATEDRWEDTGNSWEDVVRGGWRLSAAWGRGTNQAPAYDPDAVIDVQWEPAETRNDRDEVETLAIEVEMLGLSRTTALRKRGHDPDEEAQLRADENSDGEAPPPPGAPVMPGTGDGADAAQLDDVAA